MRHLFAGHVCKTAQHMGWTGKKNGELLRLAEAAFDVFVTSDQNIRYQQNLSGRRIAIVELSTNKLRRIRAAADLIQGAIQNIRPGDFIQVKIP
jgi:hypothetical protein